MGKVTDGFNPVVDKPGMGTRHAAQQRIGEYTTTDDLLTALFGVKLTEKLFNTLTGQEMYEVRSGVERVSTQLLQCGRRCALQAATEAERRAIRTDVVAEVRERLMEIFDEEF
jgi:hypothetical protein